MESLYIESLHIESLHVKSYYVKEAKKERDKKKIRKKHVRNTLKSFSSERAAGGTVKVEIQFKKLVQYSMLVKKVQGWAPGVSRPSSHRHKQAAGNR